MPKQIVLQGFPSNFFGMEVTIPSGSSLSEVFCPQGMAVVGVFMSAGWDAAAIGWKVGNGQRAADQSFVHNAAGIASTTGALTAATYVAFPAPDALFGPFMQVASVTANTSTGVNQTADRVLLLVMRNYLN